MSAESFLYFIKPVGMDGPIKIGYSTKPAKRLLVLSAWSPFVLEIIGTAPGSSPEEAFLHRHFSHLHTHREWFNSSPELRRAIEMVLTGYSVKEACADIAPKEPIRNQKRKLPTPERQLFIDYGKRIRKVLCGLKSTDQGSYYAPPDVREIMEDWRGDYIKKPPITPSAPQIARLEEFLSDPRKHAVFLVWSRLRENQDHFSALAEAFEQQKAAMLGAAQ